MAFPVKVSQDEIENNGLIKGVKSFWNMITGQTSKELAEKNYNLQKQMYDYQVQLNQTQMDREDTAYQRAVKDANAAGLSALSVGNGASSSALSSGEAPQMNDYASNNFTNGLNLINSLTQFQNNITQQVLQNKKQNAEINKINAETNAIDRENQYFDYTIDKRKNMFDNDYYDSLIKKQFNDKYGFFNGASDMDKYAILGKLSPEAYSESIMANNFSNLGVILGLISKIGSAFSKGNIDSAEGLLKTASSNILPQLNIDIKNNGIKTKNNSLLNWLFYHPFKKNSNEVLNNENNKPRFHNNYSESINNSEKNYTPRFHKEVENKKQKRSGYQK